MRKIDLPWLLVLAIPLFTIILWINRLTPDFNFKLVAVAALLYLAVAFIHHRRDKTLTLEIIIEYILIAALVLIIL